MLKFINQQLVKAKPEFHKQTFLKPFHKTAEFCGACHKVHLPEELNKYKWLLMAAAAAGQNLTPAQKEIDFRNLVATMNNWYAPLDWKKELFGFDALRLKPWLDRVAEWKVVALLLLGVTALLALNGAAVLLFGLFSGGLMALCRDAIQRTFTT